MMISELVAQDKDISIVKLAGKLEQFVRRAAEDGECLHDVEQKILGSVLLLGRQQFPLAAMNASARQESCFPPRDRRLAQQNRRIAEVQGPRKIARRNAPSFCNRSGTL